MASLLHLLFEIIYGERAADSRQWRASHAFQNGFGLPHPDKANATSFYQADVPWQNICRLRPRLPLESHLPCLKQGSGRAHRTLRGLSPGGERTVPQSHNIAAPLVENDQER